MFQGASALALDGKGRLTIPARHRELLDATAGGKLTITRNPEGFLMLVPRPEWEAYREAAMALKNDAASWRRILIGNAMDVEIDGSSRVLISPELRTAVGLTREVMLLGLGRYFELWDRAKYEAFDAAVAQSPMPESIKNFAF
ncbi:MAG: division/cell wall cluster transcriptional repressor MraZ [Burkholderiaceae bacterium]